MGVRITTSDGICFVRLEEPAKKNALSRAMLRDLQGMFANLDPLVHGVVLTGGPAVFSAGADLDEMHGDERDGTYDDEVSEVTRLIRSAGVPVIAALEGPCLGAAVDLALACDARVAAAGCYLQVPATRLGILYNPAAVQRWVDEFGAAVVREMLLFGARMPAETAYVRGLVMEPVPTGAALAAAEALLSGATDQSREARAATKALVNECASVAVDPADWQQRRRRLLGSQHRRQALASHHAGRAAR